jgi:cell division control protein 24
MMAMAAIMTSLRTLTANFTSIPTDRVAIIDVDQVVAMLTDGVHIFDQLKDAIPQTPSLEKLNGPARMRIRMQWAAKEGGLSTLITRLQDFKNSVNAILNIIQT